MNKTKRENTSRNPFSFSLFRQLAPINSRPESRHICYFSSFCY